jgi:flavodoxin
LENLLTGINNAKTLHDYDNYQAALDDYAYTNYKTGTSAPGYEAKQKDLKQFFSRTQKSNEEQTSERE